MHSPHQVSRRQLLHAGVLGLGGLSLSQLYEIQASLGKQLKGKARNAIFVFLNGGPSQLDTFDMKPDAPEGIRGPYKPIATAVPGTQICEKLPRLARLADKYSILRSANHPLTAHNSSAAYVLSGHSPGTDADIVPSATDHPTYGSVVSRLRPSGSAMPDFVLTPRLLFDMGFPTPSAGGGWLGRIYDPFPVVRNRMMARAPAWSGTLPVPEALTLPETLTTDRLGARQHLLGEFNKDFPAGEKYRDIRTLDSHRSQALELLLSPSSREAFDVSKEPDEYHERYGRFEMGQAMLLSRRLIESGVRFVTANAVSNPANTRLSPFQIWDTHFDHFRLYNDNLLPEFDQAFSALISDLDERGLLDETLVFAMGEMGRTPKINDAKDGGRDHWGRAYSVLWAGAGVHAGGVFGATDKHAADVIDMPASPDDIAATIYEAMGIPYDTVLTDFRGQPRHITDGRPVAALLS